MLSPFSFLTVQEGRLGIHLFFIAHYFLLETVFRYLIMVKMGCLYLENN